MKMAPNTNDATVPKDAWGIRFLARRDLQFTRCVDKHETWNAFDPVTRQSTRIGLIEYLILSRVNGRRTLRQLTESLFEDNIPIEADSIAVVAARLQSMGLLRTSEVAKATSSSIRTFQQVVSSFVVWQVRGVNPDTLLRHIAPKCGFLFSKPAVFAWCTLMSVTAAFVSLDFVRISEQTATWQGTLMGASGLAFGGWLLAVFLVTRALHELGHAIACHRQGVRCPDIGLLFIMCAPCVYCDVSESWRLPRRSQRAAVAAGGMYIELIVATVASWIWLATVDSPVNTLALQAMCVCSISTILINANPLMRFDGYYILADWLDEVNLRSKADRLLLTQVSDWALGKVQQSNRSRTTRRDYMLMLFSAAGWCYRSLLALAIAGGITMLWSGWNLVWVGRALGCAILISWWGIPMIGFVKSLGLEASRRGRRSRLAIIMAAFVVIVAVAPVPTRRVAKGWVRPKMMQGIYASETATLVDCSVNDGQIVSEGQELFRFRDENLAAALVSSSAAVRNARTQYASMRRSRDMYGYDIDLTPYATRTEALENQVSATRKRYEELTLSAVVGGTIVAGEAIQPRELTGNSAAYTDASVTSRSTWCSRQQIGRTVQAGTLLASIRGDDYLAVVPLSAEQLRDVAVGTRCKLRLVDAHRSVIAGTVSNVVRLDANPATTGSSSPVHSQPASTQTTAGTSYAAIIELPHQSGELRFCDEAVDVVFHTQSTSLFQLARVWLIKNLRFLSQ